MKSPAGFKFVTFILILLLSVGCLSREEATPSLPASSVLAPIESPLTEPLSPLEVPSQEEQMKVVEDLFQLASADLATELGLDAEDIELIEAERVEWPNTSLGCPQPGMMYAQMITPGYRLTLKADGEEYVYHTDGGQQAVRCDEKP